MNKMINQNHLSKYTYEHARTCLFNYIRNFIIPFTRAHLLMVQRVALARSLIEYTESDKMDKFNY